MLYNPKTIKGGTIRFKSFNKRYFSNPENNKEENKNIPVLDKIEKVIKNTKRKLPKTTNIVF